MPGGRHADCNVRRLPDRNFLGPTYATQLDDAYLVRSAGTLHRLIVLVPLLRTVRLPSVRTVSTPISAGRAAITERRPQTSSPAAGQIPPIISQLLLPRQLPSSAYHGRDDAVEPPVCPGCIGDGVEGLSPAAGGGIPIPGLLGGLHPVMPTPPPATAGPVFRQSSILEGSLIRRVQPIYPPLARAARIQGAVVLFAVISKEGTIENLRAISGQPMLVLAAKDAVSQWRYRPYILNDEAIEVETQITVNFTLSGN